jgi:hypothetical protein
MSDMRQTGSPGALVVPAIKTVLATATLSLMLTVGTGGVSDARTVVMPGTNFEPWNNGTDATDGGILAERSATIVDALVAIRSNFGLSVVDLARVLGVSRQTLYDWSSERQAAHPYNARRIVALQALSNVWRSELTGTGNAVHRKFVDKERLLRALSSEDLMSAAVVSDIRSIARIRASEASAPSISDLMKAHGFEAPSPLRQAQAIDDAIR